MDILVNDRIEPDPLPTTGEQGTGASEQDMDIGEYIVRTQKCYLVDDRLRLDPPLGANQTVPPTNTASELNDSMHLGLLDHQVPDFPLPEINEEHRPIAEPGRFLFAHIRGTNFNFSTENPVGIDKQSEMPESPLTIMDDEDGDDQNQHLVGHNGMSLSAYSRAVCKLRFSRRRWSRK